MNIFYCLNIIYLLSLITRIKSYISNSLNATIQCSLTGVEDVKV